MSSSSLTTVAPALWACAKVASTSSTYMKTEPLGRRPHVRLRKRIRQHQLRIADLQLGVPDPAVGPGHAQHLLGAERLLVEVDRARGVVDGEIRREAVVALRNRIDGHGSSLRSCARRS